MDNVMFLTVRNSEGALERLLRVTRHRGFAIDSLLVQNGRDPSLYEVTLRLSSERESDNLQKQLAKLVDVVAVQAMTAQPMLRNAV